MRKATRAVIVNTPAALCAALLMVALAAGTGHARTGQEIEASANAAVQRFYKEVKGGREVAQKARAMLVMPGVIKGAFIVGGEYGEGALRVGGKTVAYYNLASGSIGFSIGGESKDIVLLFMTDAALAKFRAHDGWEAGVDGNVALVNMGGGERVDFTKMKDPILGFVFGVKGLMADISLKGAKFTRIAR